MGQGKHDSILPRSRKSLREPVPVFLYRGMFHDHPQPQTNSDTNANLTGKSQQARGVEELELLPIMHRTLATNVWRDGAGL